jgi:hypothetical protein
MSMMNPLAGPSGPGKYSTRTDQLSLGSTSYGEGQDTASINTAAAKSKTRGIADNVGGRPSNPITQAPITSLFSPTQRPNEPITHGIDMGAGAGSEALMMKQGVASTTLSNTLAKMLPYDTTGEIGILYQQALSRGM